jgi:hypothetical protein
MRSADRKRNGEYPTRDFRATSLLTLPARLDDYLALAHGVCENEKAVGESIGALSFADLCGVSIFISLLAN